MKKLKQILSWLDTNGLFILSAFLIVFIPLFPKIPIFNILPGYIVRARPEDVLIFIASIIWIKDAYKKRFNFSSTYFWLVVLYSISGLISIFLATFLLHSIPEQLLHIAKSSLHLFRYLEYFALFFFSYSSITTKKHLKIILALLVFTIISIVLYGFGQEYFHLPLFSTMNREYSKGVTLYLQEGARPQSTFAGHYDLAAYLVIVLPIIFSMALSFFKINFKNLKDTFKQKNNLISVFLHFVHIIGAWMLVTSGSKTALLAYIAGIFVVLIHYLRKLGTLKQKLKWSSFAFVSIITLLILFLNFFAQSTRDQLITLVKNTTNTSQIPNNPDATPDDLIGDGVVFKQISIKNADGTESKKWIEEKSSWSQNALKYGLSMGIRLDSLWPNAVKGFANNPLFGNGYSTLAVVDNPGEYNNADSTDNNFLRTLGETGVFGFVIFYGFIFIIFIEVLKSKTDSHLEEALKAGFLGSIIGILINATYIDVFAASKVAYTFWAFAGITLATLKPNSLNAIKRIIKYFTKHWPIYLAIVLSFFLLHKNPINKYALIRDLNVTTPQIESLIAAKCFIETGSFNICRPNGLVLDTKINIYSILLLPIYKIFNNPLMFYILNMTLLVLTLFLLNKYIPVIIKKHTSSKPKKILIFSSLVLYITISTVLQFSIKPLSTIELILYLILVPSLIIIYTVIIHNIKFRLAYFIQICAILISILFLVNQGFSVEFFNQFRNDHVSNKQTVINILNVHFDTSKYLNKDSDFYLISTLNPYYTDLFSNHNYNLLPLSEQQPYYSKAENVYNQINSQQLLLPQYNKIMENNSIYITDYGIQENEAYLHAFNNLKQEFDLTYLAIGCEDHCSLYSVLPETKKTSPLPLTINDQKIQLNNLNSKYSFSIVSNRYEPKIDQKKPYTVQKFAPFLNNNISSNNSFLALTGDLINENSEKLNSIFNNSFTNSPIIFNPGNFDLYPSKVNKNKSSYFYTESEFYIILNIPENSEISSEQQRFVYNTLLQIEKLPDIKNIFVISHNLNWQDRSNPNNFIFDLEMKLNQFPELNKYIVTSHHTNSTDPDVIRQELTIKHITDSSTNINYLSSFVRDWDNDSYFEFTVNTDDSVTVDYKVKGENF